MRALRLHELGGPASLRVERVAVPSPAPDEVLVRIRAAAFNRRDVFITQGLYPGIVLPATLGSDGAGEIAAVGAQVADRSVGDSVVIDPMLGWGDDPAVWDAGASSILGMPHPGTFAEFVAVPAANVYPRPASLTIEQAAAIPLAGLTAYRALVTRGGLRAGETVLIPGVGGGVQTFALIFAKALGARAIVTSSDDAKLERARVLGADVALNYRTDPTWHKTLRAEAPIDLVVDSSGGDTLAKALDVVRPGGRVAIYGATRPEASIKLFPLFWKHVTIVGTSMGSPHDFAAMLALFDDGPRPAIDAIVTLDDAPAAAARLLASAQFGKIVVRID